MVTLRRFPKPAVPQRWQVWGGGITNHEEFAFTLSGTDNDIGAVISDVTVYVEQGPFDPLNPNSDRVTTSR